jgi:fructose-bisphosphate aldolase class II
VLVPLVDVLAKAWQEKYCVGAFGVYNLETALALRDAAVEMNSPVIALFGDYFEQTSIESIGAIMRQVAGESDAPIVLHLDHGQSINSIMRAIKSGFTSVMYDGSRLSPKENIERTRMTVEIAHAVGVSVEGSIGEMPSLGAEEYGRTDPDQAEVFASRTGIDALAVSVGNIHGIPVRASIANLDFERLAEINRRCKVPLVLHGGSGVSEDALKKAIPLGLCKLNLVTCIGMAMASRMRQQLSELDDKARLERLMPGVKSEMENLVMHYMRVLGSEGKSFGRRFQEDEHG